MAKQIITSLLIVSTAIFQAGCGIIGCAYTEEILPPPKALAEAKIIVFSKAYLAKGPSDYSCLSDFGKIKQEIVGPATIGNITIGEKYFTRTGRTVETLASGTEFRVTGVAKVKKHGITAIDSGSGPFYFLILKDKDGLEYQIATVETGINDSDRFLTYVPDSEKPGGPTPPKYLSVHSFRDGSGNFSFVGPRF
ncbi:hypothetical protein [Azonexus sp.]|jgi:hypothetical protein|uniref:hypothetical protein n=1 Tax=Azonexus sp. TaxID=1872668 RepID=UPI002824BFE9|nr:hypothetical protein [Azonexus sp.]MDR1996533.1 hypothetical protein [Azonexus sp.]